MVEPTPQYDDQIKILGLMSMIRWRTNGQPDCQLSTVLERGGLNADLIQQGVLTSPAEELHDSEVAGNFDQSINRCTNANRLDLLYRVVGLKQTIRYDASANFALQRANGTTNVNELSFLTNPTAWGYDPTTDPCNQINGGLKFSPETYEGSYLRQLVDPPRGIALPARSTEDNWCLVGMVHQLIAMLPGNAQTLRSLVEQLGSLFNPTVVGGCFDSQVEGTPVTDQSSVVNHQLIRRPGDQITRTYESGTGSALPNFPGRTIAGVKPKQETAVSTSAEILPWVEQLLTNLQAFRTSESICGPNSAEVAVPNIMDQVLALSGLDPNTVARQTFGFILPESMGGTAALLLRQAQEAIAPSNLDSGDNDDIIYRVQRQIVDELKTQRERWGDDLMTNVTISANGTGQFNRVLQNLNDYRSIVELTRHPALGPVVSALLSDEARARL